MKALSVLVNCLQSSITSSLPLSTSTIIEVSTSAVLRPLSFFVFFSLNQETSPRRLNLFLESERRDAMSFSKSSGKKSVQSFHASSSAFSITIFFPSTLIFTLSPSVIPTASRISLGIVTCECLVTITEFMSITGDITTFLTNKELLQFSRKKLDFHFEKFTENQKIRWWGWRSPNPNGFRTFNGFANKLGL